MSFLDNLENNLKALESREERVPGPKRRAEQDRNRAQAAQPYVEQLRNGRFTRELLDRVVTMAHELRTKVYINWSGNSLRLDAREHRLELQPTPEGVFAVFSTGYDVTGREKVDLKGDPAKLAQAFLSPFQRAAKHAASET
jgi:hypothetical protein